MNTTFKNIGAIVAGFIAVVILSVATDAVLEKIGVFPPPINGLFVTWMLVLALAYRCVYTILGGYITARLAADLPMRQVKILGILGLIGGALGIIAGWNLSAHWYPILIFLTAFPCTWWGGRLFTKK